MPPPRIILLQVKLFISFLPLFFLIYHLTHILYVSTYVYMILSGVLLKNKKTDYLFYSSVKSSQYSKSIDAVFLSFFARDCHLSSLLVKILPFLLIAVIIICMQASHHHLLIHFYSFLSLPSSR